ncbi:MAG: hypothetical protein ACLFO6_05890 [Archaeoglobaceae archaeon]
MRVIILLISLAVLLSGCMSELSPETAEKTPILEPGTETDNTTTSNHSETPAEPAEQTTPSRSPTPEQIPTQTTPASPATPLPATTTPTEETITRQYNWTYNGKWSWELYLPKKVYEYYKELPRLPIDYFSVYVTNPLDDKYIESLAMEIEDAGSKNNFNDWETVNLAISFVQSLKYTSDNVTTPYDEYPRYPIETLVDRGGDCEDTSILTAAILDAMGYDVVLVQLPDHMAVGILGGEGVHGTYFQDGDKKYFYVETTGEGWEIGELPPQYSGIENATIHHLKPIPVLYIDDWETGVKGDRIELTIKVSNIGSATAQNAYVYAGFDAGRGKVWNPEKTGEFDLRANQYLTATMYLRPPKDKYTRLTIQVIDDGHAMDQSYSTWFNT